MLPGTLCTNVPEVLIPENGKLTPHQCDGILLKWAEIPEVGLCHHARPQVIDEEVQ